METLDSIMNRFGIQTVNYLSLDVEGFEFNVLSGYSKVPRMLSIARQSLPAYFEEKHICINFWSQQVLRTGLISVPTRPQAIMSKRRNDASAIEVTLAEKWTTEDPNGFYMSVKSHFLENIFPFFADPANEYYNRSSKLIFEMVEMLYLFIILAILLV